LAVLQGLRPVEDVADFEARPLVGLFFRRYFGMRPVWNASGLSVILRWVMWTLQSVSPGVGAPVRVVIVARRICAAQSSSAVRSAVSFADEERAVHSDDFDAEGRVAGLAVRLNARRPSTCALLKRTIGSG
jgi:hypothetical protein